MHFAVGLASQRCIGHGANRWAQQMLRVPHHLAQGGAREQLETNHRRHGVARQTKHRHAPLCVAEQTESKRLGRFHCHLHPLHFGNARQHGFDHVKVAHAHTTTGDNCIVCARRVAQGALEQRLVVGDHTKIGDFTLRTCNQNLEHREIAFANLAAAERRAIGDEFITSR